LTSGQILKKEEEERKKIKERERRKRKKKKKNRFSGQKKLFRTAYPAKSVLPKEGNTPDEW
jgi:DNA invertase Pin-like site-specific DNA recombinase